MFLNVPEVCNKGTECEKKLNYDKMREKKNEISKQNMPPFLYYKDGDGALDASATYTDYIIVVPNIHRNVFLFFFKPQ